MLLYVAAFPPEVVALDAAHAREIVGVGLVEAALGTSAAIEAHRHDALEGVVLLGTAGAYQDRGLHIGDVVVATEVMLASVSGALVAAMPQQLATDAALTSRFDARRAKVANTLGITTQEEYARALVIATGADVEHLEAFAVARACARAGVRFTAVLGIANMVGPEGREQWRQHHEQAARAACAAIR